MRILLPGVETVVPDRKRRNAVGLADMSARPELPRLVWIERQVRRTGFKLVRETPATRYTLWPTSE